VDLFALALKIKTEGAKEATTALSQINREGAKVAKNFRDLINPANLLKGALGGIAVALTFEGIKKGLEAMFEEASNAERSVSELRVAVLNAGQSFAVVGPQAEDLVQNLMHLSRFGDEDLRDALTNLVSITGDTALSMKELGLAADIAAAKHMPVQEAATLLGKALMGNTAMLARYGIVVREGANVTEALGKKFRGFAEEDAKTMGGALSQVKNAWGDYLEILGKTIFSGADAAGMFETLRDQLIKAQEWVVKNKTEIQALVEAVVTLAKGIGVVLVVAIKLGAAAITVLGTAVKGIEMLFTTMVASIELIGPRSKQAFGWLMQTIATFVEFATPLLNKFGIHFADGWADSLRVAGNAMVTTATQQVADIKSAWEDTVNEINSGKALDRKVRTEPGAGSGPGFDARKLALKAPLEPQVTQLSWATAKVDVQKLMKDHPVKLPVIPDLDPTSWTARMGNALLEVEDKFHTMGTDIGVTFGMALGEGIGKGIASGSLTEALHSFGSAVLQGFGSVLTQLGQSLIQYGVIMLNLLPFLTNIFTSGPAALAAGVALVALGSAFGGIAGGRGKSGAGGGGGGGFGGGGFNQGTSEIVKVVLKGSTSASDNSDLTAKTPIQIGPNIGVNDLQVQRAIKQIVTNADRRNL
jgi:hypothetical protein